MARRVYFLDDKTVTNILIGVEGKLDDLSFQGRKETKPFDEAIATLKRQRKGLTRPQMISAAEWLLARLREKDKADD